MKKKHLYRSTALSALASLSLVTPTIAQDDEIDRIIVTGTRYRGESSEALTRAPIELKALPNSISIITADSIFDRNAQSLGSQLATVGGVVGNDGVFNYDGIIIRGVTDVGAPILVRLRENGLAGGVSYPADFFSIERLEVIKGPASIAGGSVEPGGFVNRQLKSAATESDNRLQVLGETYGKFHGGIDISAGLPGDETIRGRLVVASAVGRDFTDFVRESHVHILPSVSADITGVTKMTVIGNIFLQNSAPFSGLPIAVNGEAPPVNPNANFALEGTDANLDHYGVDVEVVHHFLDDLKLTLRAGYNQTTDERDEIYGYNYYDSGSGGLAANGDSNVYAGINIDQSERFASDVYLTKSFTVNGRTNTATFGADYLFGEVFADYGFTRLGVANLFSPTTVLTFPSDRSFASNFTFGQSRLEQIGVYCQIVLRPLERLTITSGARYDRYDIAGEDLNLDVEILEMDNALTFRGGASYDIGFDTNIYFSYSEAFTPQLVFAVGFEIVDPEESTQWEAGFKSDILADRITLTGAVFRIDRTNVAIDDPTARFFSLNGGAIRIDGFELELNGEILPGLDVAIGGSILDPAFTVSNAVNIFGVGDRPPGSTTCNAGGIISYEFQSGPLERLRVGGGGRHVCERTFVLFDIDENAATGFFDTDPFTVFDAFVGYTTKDGMRLQINLQNLQDETFIESADGLNGNVLGNGLNAAFSISRAF